MSLNIPDYDVIRSMLDYKDGRLVWKQREGNKRFNSGYAGKAAGSNKRPDGYSVIGINGRHYLAHIVTYVWHHGAYEVALDIDHINGDRSDNRIENLRLASRAENLQNAKFRSDNKTGVKGVFWNKATNSYRAVIKRFGKTFQVGMFTALEDAKVAIEKARLAMHGEFSNNGNGGMVCR